ncbi:xanthine dehydrogenase family protein molybdopterin-binding subunit [Noviherbaspirillum sp.]|uniref:xanthine dehydrogenase family protein molybdopterin-binding subunit n=1 Tax=Noviherbaspirillum sp. TaxID=1926288 RepID=UPI002B48639A|nr:xanthine dehydrogenase family protein molybdopterin-binding subunit [Noviherbaspirillum sp.]HJV80061.1 xanthine dehydrogenase family protein molybdopterin-binding subunit [Noviherbaspirillum sp.]
MNDVTRKELNAVSAAGQANAYIGTSVSRPNARRHLEGRSTYVDDVVLARMAHVVFLRCPLAHARIGTIDADYARSMPGVIAIVDGKQIAAICSPWVATLAHLPGMKSPPQYPLAIERACWQGEPVLAIVAETRQQAEDALQMVNVDWEELPAVTDMETALAPDTPVIHPELGDNLCFRKTIDTGNVDAAFAAADLVVEETYRFGRHTGVTMETRSVLADFDPAERKLTVYHSHQAPHMMQDLYARHFDLPETSVRVICKDVGGSFGIKVHSYPDDFATVALSILLKRPVKFVADRLESFVSDIHAREHVVKLRLAAKSDGEILAFDMIDLTGVGPYSVYPRTSAIEGNQVLNIVGGPYQHKEYRATLDVVFQNKAPTSQYRGVGHPIACAVTEGIVDAAAVKLGIDPLEMRRRNVMPDDSFPRSGASGIKLERLSHQQCLDKLEKLMDYPALRREQSRLREQGIYRGIGIAVLIELTNPGAAFYGVGGARIAAQDGATIRFEPTGTVTCLVGVGEQGQGTETIFAQIAADAVGVPMECVKVVTGDTEVTPYGGGTWASRGAGIGGEAVLQAGLALRENLRKLAGIVLKRDVAELDIARGHVVDRASGERLVELAELGRIIHFRPDTLPPGPLPELVVTRTYAQRDYPFAFTNGVQASYVEVDVETGFVKLLKHWAVEDCGRILNPMLVDEQMRGAIVQGIGGALFEECLYDSNGLLTNGSMADYLVPMASEMPDIVLAHVETPTATSQLGAKGAGEAGTAGAPAAVMNAINDALSPFKVSVTSQPITPEKILRALGTI